MYAPQNVENSRKKRVEGVNQAINIEGSLDHYDIAFTHYRSLISALANILGG